tara:strand:- start:8785 stop:8919 length:135 start_codon:yes stop_codon:yes gene_type:complete
MEIKAETSYIELITYNPYDDEIMIRVIPYPVTVITNKEEIYNDN